MSSPTPAALLDLDQKFWTWCWYAFAKIARGELWEALDGIHGIRSDALLPMLAWTARRPREGYRRLEGKLDRRTAARLAATAAPLEAEALYGALRAEISLYRDLREPLFDRYGLAFDPQPEGVIEDAMDRHWSAGEA